MKPQRLRKLPAQEKQRVLTALQKEGEDAKRNLGMADNDVWQARAERRVEALRVAYETVREYR